MHSRLSFTLTLLLFVIGAAAVTAAGSEGLTVPGQNGDGRQAIATDNVAGTLLTVTPGISYDEATLRIVGPNGYESKTHFEGGQFLSVNLLAEGGTLPDGRYRFEVVFRDNGREQTYSGFVEVLGGQVVPHARSPETSGQAGSAGVNAPETTNVDDILQIFDTAGDGASWMFLQSNPGATADQKNWHFRNEFGDLRWRLYTAAIPSGVDRMTLTDDGALGLGTTAPADAIHAVGAKTVIRLENTASGTTWRLGDLSDGDFSFFIDTNGGTGPTGEVMVITELGTVGIGTTTPEATLDVSRDDGTTRFQVKDTSAVVEGRTLFDMYNNGDVRFFFTNVDSGDVWQMSAFGTAFQISSPSTGRGKFRVFETGGLQALDGSDEILFLDNDGNLTVTSVTETSTRSSKIGFESVDGQDVLNKVATLPISTWSYKNGDPAVRHLGPMAEDFYAAFGLGKDNTGLTNVDTAGVAFAAIQGLNAKLAAKNARIEELEARLTRLEALIGVSAGE